MYISTVERSSADRANELCQDSFNSLLDDSPVMMTKIEISEGLYSLAQVNDRILEATGYKRDELLGRDTCEFLAEPSKVRAISLRPTFERLHSAKSFGVTILPKDGLPFEVLVDFSDLPSSGQNLVRFGGCLRP